MFDAIYHLDNEKDADKLVALLGAECFAELDKYGFNMGSCAIFPGDLNLKGSIKDLHEDLILRLDEEYLTTIIVVGNLIVEGRLDNTKEAQ